MKKFYSDIEALCGFTVAGTTSLSTATGITVATSDNSTKLATTAFVKAQGYLTAEVDTLDTVTDRNSVTTNSIGVGTINIIGTTAGAELLTVDGTFGRLFTVTDDLSDSLFSVNTIAGLPVIEVFADNTINLGAFSNPITIDGSSNIVIPGTITASGYNDTNWNTAYNDRIISAAVSGTTTKTLTLTQTDGGTISTSWTDINTDTDGYISNVSLVGSTLSFTSVGSAFSGIVDLSTLTPTVRTVFERVKNTSGATILKGTPLAVVPGQTSGNLSDVIPADASDPAKMPAVFIANQNIADEAEGEAVLFGNLTGVDTSLYPSGTTVYVAAGGGWTADKPIWPNLIQNLGVITKQHPTNGAGIVTGVGRANSLPNLTAGKIWVGSATYPIESTTVHVDEANGRVGIGTTSPLAPLHISDTSSSNLLVKLRVQNDLNQAEFGTQSGYARILSGGSLLYAGSGSATYFYYSGSTLMSLVSNNVGIGTTSPSAKLTVIATSTYAGIFSSSSGEGTIEVQGAASSNARIRLLSNAGATVPSASLTASDHKQIIHKTNNDFAVQQYDTSNGWQDLLTIKSSGNVGIGTTSPEGRLHIAGGHLLLNNGIELRSKDTGGSVRTIARVNSSTNDLEYGWSGAGAVKFMGGGAYTERMRIHTDGNVGIGTASPAAKLHTVGEGIVNIVQSSNTVSYTQYYTSSTGAGGTNDGLTVGLNGFDGYVFLREAANLILGTSETERLRITSAGNVGIGTTTANTLLSIDGVADNGISIQGIGTTATRAFFGLDASGDGYMSLKNGSTFATNVQLSSDLGVANYFLGNVGIGTTNPTNKLQVANGNMSITTGYSFILADTDTNWRLGRNIIVESGNNLTANTFQLVAANAVNEGWQFVNDDGFTVLEIGAETSARNVWINSGNLSVGVASPQEKIHVAGNVRIDGGSTAAILETNDATAAEAGTIYRTFTTADHYAVFVDYVVYDAGRDNMRTGTFRAVWSTGDVVYTDVSTVDLGATDNVTLTAAISGANVNLIVTGPADYTLKYSLKVIK